MRPGSMNRYIHRSRRMRARSGDERAAADVVDLVGAMVALSTVSANAAQHSLPHVFSAALELLFELLAHLIAAAAAPVGHELIVRRHRIAAADDGGDAVGGQRLQLASLGNRGRR